MRFSQSLRFVCSAVRNARVVEVEKLSEVTMISINRPEKKNAVNIETANALVEAFDAFESDKEARVAVFYGRGGTFCAGFDLHELSKASETPEVNERLIEERSPKNSRLAFLGPSRMRFRKPVIAAIEGFAVAGGLELACMCDLRVMDEKAVLGVFCRRAGVPLIDGGTVRLPKLIGLSRALDLILTGRPVSGTEAWQMGLVNRLVSPGTCVDQALKLAKEIAKFPSQCMLADRASAYYSAFDASSLQDAFEFEYENARHVISRESVGGARAFSEAGIGRHGSFNLQKPSK